MTKVSFQMSDVQHKEWFISTLLPHIQTPLMQHKIVSQIQDENIKKAQMIMTLRGRALD